MAVCGILFANVLIFFGIFAMPEARQAALPTAAADHVAAFLEHVFISGKFYSVFSLLFGIGFGIQLARGGDEALPRFSRRLKVLLVIGAIHALFIWAGDILMLYALLGFTLPWFARKSDRQLLRWTVVLLPIPSALYLVAVGIALAMGGGGGGSGGDGMPPEILKIFEAVGTGGVREAFIGNLLLLVGRWVDLIATMRFPKVLGMFVLGLWLVRRGIALRPADHRPLLVRWAAIGWLVGLPANLLAAWGQERWSYLPPSSGGLLTVLAQAVGVPMLALGYAATVVLLAISGVALIRAFAPMGRMALTNYLMHSVICVALAAGWGAGLWWRIGASRAMAIAAVILPVQMLVSAWWMSRNRFGPAEWVWRHFTSGKAREPQLP
ncbi:MAG TPA: DUF418 domain-containing protein [Gemmatimonadaceae bacterium]|nr:DUF418 domain-containing protein [Gemmatimonadaceae bacterium]